ncbi:MAG TPA: exodeoxyribonuclease III [Saprospiraceae bacterium]|nr:exodeoxyribonuclease III [Saprospiraceae bacterium]HMP25351.1 exodeoxyribonuclease III [Saprospiraceae bacterium]
MSKKIVSYNLNGLRSALSKGFAEWLQTHQFDIVCVQETKAQREQVDHRPFIEMGYHDSWHSAEKKGYSGVATFSKIQPDHVVEGCGLAKYDAEGRILRTDFGDWTLLNCYFPSGTTGDVRQDFKMEFLDDFFNWIQELKKERPQLIVVGDYNIAHQEIDIHNPKGNAKSSGFLPEERAWMSRWFEAGFTDAFRYLNPDAVQYSWWSFRANARANNKGWRIDYQSVTNGLRDRLVYATHLTDAVHSDHCPVLLEIDL